MADTSSAKTWAVNLTSLFFILVQSACTAVMAISGFCVVIGLGALAAATVGINGPATGFHRAAIRIPMMAIAVIGSVINLYVIWRIRSLRPPRIAVARSARDPEANAVGAHPVRARLFNAGAG